MTDITNQTGCMIQGMLYNRWITVLTRTGTGRWRSEEKINGRFLHKSSDILLTQVISQVKVDG